MGLQQVGIATSWRGKWNRHLSSQTHLRVLNKAQDGCGAAVGLLVGWEAQYVEVEITEMTSDGDFWRWWLLI